MNLQDTQSPVEETTTTPAEETTPTPPAPTQTPIETPIETPLANSATPDGASDNLPNDITELKKIVHTLRNENGKNRVEAKAKAAADAEASLVDKIGRVLGLIKDETTIPTTDELTQQLEQQARDHQAERLQFAVFKASQGIADPDLLLDSQKFTQLISSHDHTDTAGIQETIRQFITDNPRYAPTQAVRATSVDHPAGSGENDITREQFQAMSIAERNELYQRDRATYERLVGVN